MKIGFIGLGNMATAMIGGMLSKGIVTKEEIVGAEIVQSVGEQVASQFGITLLSSNKEVVKKVDFIILAVKPQFFPDVISEIRSEVTDTQIVLSIAAGKTLSYMEREFGKSLKLIRCMPNTPALVSEGCTGVCTNELVTEEEKEYALKLLTSFGKASLVTEHLMDAVVAVSGSSPAYVFIMIEAMADAAVLGGMPRKQAYEFAAQAVYGSAKMVLETGKHPGELKDMVCSPGGTTIEAVKVLEELGFRAAIMDAMEACIDKSKNM